MVRARSETRAMARVSVRVWVRFRDTGRTRTRGRASVKARVTGIRFKFTVVFMVRVELLNGLGYVLG
jgi:hypothetical protein